MPKLVMLADVSQAHGPLRCFVNVCNNRSLHFRVIAVIGIMTAAIMIGDLIEISAGHGLDLSRREEGLRKRQSGGM